MEQLKAMEYGSRKASPYVLKPHIYIYILTQFSITRVFTGRCRPIVELIAFFFVVFGKFVLQISPRKTRPIGFSHIFSHSLLVN